MGKQRDKLIELIVNAKRADPKTGSFTEFLADFLLGYGVFVPDDGYDLDRLRELVEADKAGRCVLLPVKPNLKQGAEESRCFILLDNGEICEENVYSVSIGPDNRGNMNTIYSTFDFGDFESQEVGNRIFWDEESATAQKGGANQ